jgi:hypothetical protein
MPVRPSVPARPPVRPLARAGHANLDVLGE